MKLGFIAIALAATSVSGLKHRYATSVLRNSLADAVDCVVTDWSAWGECSAKCGGGVKSRTRTTITQASGDGAACPELKEETQCNMQQCAVDCVVSDWSPAGECSAKCGGGVAAQTRTIVTKNAFGGQKCPSLKKQVACNTDPCPVDCVVSEWSAFGDCSTQCGGGEHKRTRTVVTPAANGGKECPALEDSQVCGTEPCAVDCVVGEWGVFGECSAKCGGGTMTRTRTVTTPAAEDGAACPHVEQSVPCNTQACPVDCVASDWSVPSECSATCGGGVATRTRSVVTRNANGGQQCPDLSEEIACGDAPCPVDCVVSNWGPFGDCSKPCDGGEQKRARTVVTPAANGGKECPVLEDSRVCNPQACAVDCVVGEWGVWGECSAKCGGGEMSRTRAITTAAANGGAACPETTQTATCNTHECPVDCVVSDWSEPSQCSVTCGGGIATETRTVVTKNAFGGNKCPALTRHVPCSTQPCPVDCVVSNWGLFGECSKPCGGGEQVRARTVLQEAANGGKACPALAETAVCNSEACAEPVDCVVSEWSSYGECSAKCGGGTMTRTRTVTTPAANDGAACPGPLEEKTSCNWFPCPVDCKVSDFGAWGECSAKCGGGSQSRTRRVTQAPKYQGAACPALTESQKCNTQGCVLDCVLSDWGEWTACNKINKKKQRRRTIKTQPKNGGKACPNADSKDMFETVACTVL